MSTSLSSQGPISFRVELRRRLLPHALYFFILWPLATAVFAGLLMREQSAGFATISPAVAIGGMFAGIGRMWPEFLFGGLLLFVFTTTLFALVSRLAGRSGESKLVAFLYRGFEPLLFTLAVAVGVASEFPGLLRHSAFRLLRDVSVLTAILLMVGAVLVVAATYGFVRNRWRGALVLTAAVVSITGGSWLLAQLPFSLRTHTAQHSAIVLLGIDSISQADDVRPLYELTAASGGVWYQRPMTPGLLTNAVLPSIFMSRYPRENGVFFIFQSVDWKRAPWNLVEEAKRRGYETWSYFSGQFTCYLGSQAGFDHDRSSPKGWIHLTSSGLKDASVFLPLILPRLPRLPFSVTAPNQDGTFTYDLQEELEEILSSGSGGRRPFIAGHVDYLHASNYPRMRDLTSAQRRAVLRADVDAIQDMSLHWQYPEASGDPIGVYGWKIAHAQRALARAIERTRFLDPQRRNRLVIFSDHGRRIGVTRRNFGEPQYHRVILATFGVPPRDPRLPISLMDIPQLIGMPAPGREIPHEPRVEYANANQMEWLLLAHSLEARKRGSRFEFDGEVLLDPLIIAEIGERLTAYTPYAADRQDYRQVPTAPHLHGYSASDAD